jgi:uncharacterized membrane protein
MEAKAEMTAVPNPSGRKAVPGAKPGPSTRFAFVDLLRGLALVVMIETHVVNAYLPMASRKNLAFFWLSFVNGLVAPSFLFAAGFSLVLQARRQWQDWLSLGAAFWKQIRRLGFILIVAYYLHLPHFGLSRFLAIKDVAFWKAAFQADVLQCIVISLLIADILILLTRRPSWFAWSAGFVGLVVALLTPWMWSQDFSARVPLFVAMFLNPNGKSLFPLFPWVSFVLAGCCAAHVFLSAVSRQADASYMKRIVILASGAIIVALVIRQIPFFSFWNVGFYTMSPLYVVIRIGCVLLIGAGLYFMEKRFGWVPQSLRLAGQESLLVYCAHLMLIFSVLRRTQITAILGLQADYLGCFLMSAVIIVLMILMAKIWHAWKKDHPRGAQRALMVTVLISVIVFLLR